MTVSYLPFVNPATNEQFGQVAAATPQQACAAVAEMRRAGRDWGRRPVAERVAVLRQLQGVLIEARDEISATITQDTGKPRQDALIEVFITVDMLNDACHNAARWLRRERVSSGLYLFKRAYVEPRPYGVVAIISPWNYPLALCVPPMVAALLAGNTVVLKPSEVTAATGALVERLVQRVPELSPFVRVLHGDGAVGAAIVSAPPDYIFLTGSTETGKKVMRAAAEHVTPLTCELGGKDAMIVLDDADLDAAARWGAWGAYFNAGQTCMAVERVYVQSAVYDEFVAKAVAATDALQVGYSLDTHAQYQMGPITFPHQMDVIEQHMADARAKGARVLAGGHRHGSFYEPTVLVNVNHDMLVMQEETFGPLLPIMRADDEAAAIRLANDSPFGLSASVWSRDAERAARVAEQLQTGSVIFNDTIAHFGVPQMPFGGVKQSGFGRTHGKAGVLQFTQPHAFAVGAPPQALDVATVLRRPGHYRLGTALLRLAFGVTPRQRLEPVTEELNRRTQGIDSTWLGLGLGAAALAAALAVVLSVGPWRSRRKGR
jgi:acyl-CoA reductase-like NAD-dependent aldehyde dehydrogenase